MKRLLLIVYLATVASGVQAATQYRDFTSAEGKTIRGAVKAYDAQKKIVTIERDNRKTAKVPITVFSETDQTYILEWDVLRNFTMERIFKISAKRNKYDNEGERSKSRNKAIDVEDTHYEILLENKSASEFKGLKLEYCIYYEQEEIRNSKDVCDQGVYCGDLSIGSMAPQSKHTLQTESVSIFKRELIRGIYGSQSGGGADISNVQRGDVHGVWIRIHLKLPSGQTGTREFCYPDSLNNNRAWVSSSIRAGRN